MDLWSYFIEDKYIAFPQVEVGRASQTHQPPPFSAQNSHPPPLTPSSSFDLSLIVFCCSLSCRCRCRVAFLASSLRLRTFDFCFISCDLLARAPDPQPSVQDQAHPLPQQCRLTRRRPPPSSSSRGFLLNQLIFCWAQSQCVSPLAHQKPLHLCVPAPAGHLSRSCSCSCSRSRSSISHIFNFCTLSLFILALAVFNFSAFPVQS